MITYEQYIEAFKITRQYQQQIKSNKSDRYGKLTFVEFAGLRNKGGAVIHKREMWGIFLCDCGNSKECRMTDVKTGKIMSCGCHNKLIGSLKSKTHGCSNERLYNIWRGMLRRCYDQKEYSAYKYYGDKGVIVCGEWKSNYLGFREWALNNGYAKDLTLDRYPNKQGNYEPNNCRWATELQQRNNRINTISFNINGEEKLLYDLCKEYNMPYDLVWARATRQKWNIIDALTMPIDKRLSEMGKRGNKIRRAKADPQNPSL